MAVAGWLRRSALALAWTAAWAALPAVAPQPAAAVEFDNLYTLTVDVDDDWQDVRARAVERAMRGLLTRVTGDRDAGSDPELEALVENASRYVSSYALLERGRAQVEFYAREVDERLAALERPVWGPERPLTLIWLAIDGGRGERALLAAEGFDDGLSPEMQSMTAEVREALETVAEERGLPIAFPLLDLEDRSRITFADVWGGFDDSVLAASARYGADAVLVGRFRVTAFGNSLQWALLRDGERRSFASGDAAAGLHWVADTYAQDFSVIGGARTIRLVVRGVADLADYGRVMSYLEDLSALEAIDVESLEGGRLSLRAAARGGAGVLERVFTIGRVLQVEEPASGPGPGSGSGADGGATLMLRVARNGSQP